MQFNFVTEPLRALGAFVSGFPPATQIIALFVGALLVIIMLVLATQQGSPVLAGFTIVLVVAGLVAGLSVLVWRHPGSDGAAAAPDDERADVGCGIFMAAPMDGDSDFGVDAPVDRRDTAREQLLQVFFALQDVAGDGEDVYYGGRDIPERKGFDRPEVGYARSREMLRSCNRFALIWPARTSTSALFELGLACATGASTVIFYRNEEHLPYLLRGRKAEAADNWRVRFIQYDTLGELSQTIKSEGAGIFPQS